VNSKLLTIVIVNTEMTRMEVTFTIWLTVQMCSMHELHVFNWTCQCHRLQCPSESVITVSCDWCCKLSCL